MDVSHSQNSQRPPDVNAGRFVQRLANIFVWNVNFTADIICRRMRGWMLRGWMHARGGCIHADLRYRVANVLACSARTPLVTPTALRVYSARTHPVLASAGDLMKLKHDIFRIFLAENMGPCEQAPYDPRLHRLLSSTKPLFPPAQCAE